MDVSLSRRNSDTDAGKSLRSRLFRSKNARGLALSRKRRPSLILRLCFRISGPTARLDFFTGPGGAAQNWSHGRQQPCSSTLQQHPATAPSNSAVARCYSLLQQPCNSALPHQQHPATACATLKSWSWLQMLWNRLHGCCQSFPNNWAAFCDGFAKDMRQVVRPLPLPNPPRSCCKRTHFSASSVSSAPQAAWRGSPAQFQEVKVV